MCYTYRQHILEKPGLRICQVGIKAQMHVGKSGLSAFLVILDVCAACALRHFVFVFVWPARIVELYEKSRRNLPGISYQTLTSTS
jgi:hypothetical protein